MKTGRVPLRSVSFRRERNFGTAALVAAQLKVGIVTRRLTLGIVRVGENRYANWIN